MSKMGLDDWKITGPIGLAVAIPALSNGVRYIFIGYLFLSHDDRFMY